MDCRQILSLCGVTPRAKHLSLVFVAPQVFVTLHSKIKVGILNLISLIFSIPPFQAFLKKWLSTLSLASALVWFSYCACLGYAQLW